MDESSQRAWWASWRLGIPKCSWFFYLVRIWAYLMAQKNYWGFQAIFKKVSIVVSSLYFKLAWPCLFYPARKIHSLVRSRSLSQMLFICLASREELIVQAFRKVGSLPGKTGTPPSPKILTQDSALLHDANPAKGIVLLCNAITINPALL